MKILTALRGCAQLLVAIAVVGVSLRAQVPAELTPEAIEAQAKAVIEAPEIEPAVKERIAPVHATALEAAKAAAASKANASAALAAVAAAPKLTEDKRAELAGELPPLPKLEELANDELPKLEERLRAAQRGRDQATSDLQAKEAARQKRSARLLLLPGEIASAGDDVARLGATPLEGAADDAPTLTEARRLRRAARTLALTARVEELDAEKRQFEAEAELLTVERDLLARAATRQTRLVELLDQAVQASRRADAADDAQQADEQAQRVHPVLAAIAEANQKLTAARERWTKELATVRADLKREQELRTSLESRFAEIEKRIKIAGLTDAIGLQLRQERSKLPAVRLYLASIESRRAQLVEAQLEQLTREDERKQLHEGRELLLGAALARLPADMPVMTRSLVEVQGRELLERGDEFLASLINDLDAFVRALVELDTEGRQLLQRSRYFANYINERVLWIRGTKPIWATDWGLVSQSARWFLDSGGWRRLGQNSMVALERSPISFLSVTLLALLIVAFRRPAKLRITAAAEAAASNRMTSIVPTAWALAMTIVAAVGLPLLLWHLASQVQQTPGIGDFSSAIAGGLAHVALLFGAAELFRQAMRPSGLAEAHLRWPSSRTRLFRRNLVWFLSIFLPLAFVLQTLTLHAHSAWGSMLDRLLLVAMLIAIAVLLARVLNPHKGALASSTTGRQSNRRSLWFALGIAAPSLLILVAAAGYHFTALELLHRLELSLGVVVLAVLIDGLGLRWMLLAKRRLAIAQAKVRREAAKAKSAKEGAEAQREAPQVQEESLSLASVDAQSRKLLSGGLVIVLLLALWGIWSDVLPALRGLDDFAAWHDTTEVTRIVDGKTIVETVPQVVTWGNLLLALLILVITGAAARNIPGLLELVVLQRLQYQAGERHAVTTLVRYLIVTVGVVCAFSNIGLGWGKIQWLVAAVSVGLGFGLQEIFANFVSGIIILFERPIRVGDLVTVGEVSGYVTRIRMRATTIMDFDRKELIVPNKEFVTARLVNWTLTDPVTRMVLSVGVAYGSDTDLARQLLLQAAKDNPLVLDDPSPSALFRRFGESSLDFDLRVFIASRDYWPQVVDSLHSSIDRAFRDAKIEIAFPQRDIHVRTVGSLAEVIDDSRAPAAAPEPKPQ